MTKNNKINNISEKIAEIFYPLEESTAEVKTFYEGKYHTKAFNDPKYIISRKKLEPLFRACYEDGE